jgi:hypothetical protein
MGSRSVLTVTRDSIVSMHGDADKLYRYSIAYVLVDSANTKLFPLSGLTTSEGPKLDALQMEIYSMYRTYLRVEI